MSIAMRYGSAGDKGKLAEQLLTLLWENDSPDASFAAQSVTLALSRYTAVLIEYKPISGLDAAVGLVGAATTLECLSVNANNRNGRRTATVNVTDITFGDCTYNGSTTNAYCVPTRIYGMRTGAAAGGGTSGGDGGGGGSLPAGGSLGDVLVKSAASGGASWVTPASSAEEDNTRPITAAAVYTEIGNINALLGTI